MIDGLSFTLTACCALAAVVFGVLTLVRRFRWRVGVVVVGLLEAGLVVQAVIDAAHLVSGTAVGERGAHLAYLALSVLTLPIGLSLAHTDDDRWAGAVLVVALIVCAVVVLRMQTTYRVG